MPTDTFTDSIAENLHMQTTALRPRRQNSVQSVLVEENDQKQLSSSLPNGDSNEYKGLFRRSKSRIGYWCGILAGIVLVGWLIALTLMVHNLTLYLTKLGPVDTTQHKSGTEESFPTNSINHIHTDIIPGPDVSYGVINMELDVMSLFDNTTQMLKYKTEQHKIKSNYSGVKYNENDGSFKIQKTGLFVIYSKILVINFDSEKTVAFMQCVLIGNDNPECDQIKTLPKTRFPSHVLFVGHLQKDTVINVHVNRKDLIFRDALYNKLKIIEYALT